MTDSLEQQMADELGDSFTGYVGRESSHTYDKSDPLQSHYAAKRRASLVVLRNAAHRAERRMNDTAIQTAILTLIPVGEPPIETSWRPKLVTLLISVSKVCKVSTHDLRSNRRERPIARARQIFFWLARHYTPCSYPQVARFCGKDHTTLIHGVKKITQSLYAYQDEIDAIKKLAGIA